LTSSSKPLTHRIATRNCRDRKERLRESPL
jgi:hypothetical protein